MKKNYRWIILLTLPALLFSFNSDAKDKGIDLAAIKAYAKAEVTIEQLRKQKEVNWPQICRQYEIAAPIVKVIDSKHKTKYDKEIIEALKKCSANEKASINQQIIGKGLQHVAVLAIQDELKNIGKTKGSEENIASFFEGIRPTLIRRDKDFFKGEKNLEKSADQSLLALQNKDAKDQLTTRIEFENVLMRTYALSVLYEVIEIESLRDSNLLECDVKRMEALIFYRIIQPKIKKRNAHADDVITNMLNGNYTTMNSKILEENLNLGLSGIKLR